MSADLIGRTTMASSLKVNLDAGALRVRDIADRVARASVRPGQFQLPDDGAAADGPAGTDVESDMAQLAEEQARYEATAKLLAKAYAGLRASLQDR